MFNNRRHSNVTKPMSLRPPELAQVVEELNVALRSAVVQKAFAPLPQLWYLELRQPGCSILLCVSAEPGASRISVASERFSPARDPAAIQGRLRKCLVGTTLREIHFLPPSRIVLELNRKDASFWISASVAGRDAVLSLLTEPPPPPRSVPRRDCNPRSARRSPMPRPRKSCWEVRPARIARNRFAAS